MFAIKIMIKKLSRILSIQSDSAQPGKREVKATTTYNGHLSMRAKNTKKLNIA